MCKWEPLPEALDKAKDGQEWGSILNSLIGSLHDAAWEGDDAEADQCTG